MVLVCENNHRLCNIAFHLWFCNSSLNCFFLKGQAPAKVYCRRGVKASVNCYHSDDQFRLFVWNRWRSCRIVWMASTSWKALRPVLCSPWVGWGSLSLTRWTNLWCRGWTASCCCAWVLLLSSLRSSCAGSSCVSSCRKLDCFFLFFSSFFASEFCSQQPD